MRKKYRLSRPFPITKFSAALDLIIAASHFDGKSLALDLARQDDGDLSSTVRDWRNGAFKPRGGSRNRLLQRIESRFRCAEGFLGKLVDIEYSQRVAAKGRVSRSLQWVVEWHLPQDFDALSERKRQEILDWIDANVLDNTTEFGKYIGSRSTSSYGVVFPKLDKIYGGRQPKGRHAPNSHAKGNCGTFGTIPAPPQLAHEMEAMVRFKTSLLPPSGYRRSARWVPETAAIAVRKLGYLFGALTAAPFSRDSGLGVSPVKLTLALLVFPSVLSWFLDWSEKRKGFFTASDTSLMYQIKMVLRNPSGWVRQSPHLAGHLQPIEGLVSPKDIAAVSRDWSAACDTAHWFVSDRASELLRVGRIHRDTFAPILSVLNADSPLGEYKKIADEIIRLLPNERREPQERAAAVRAYLMLRLAVHLGVRQRNLRDLLFCKKGGRPRSPQKLEALRCGELRWNNSTKVWEVFIPALAFKNSRSSFFRGRPLLINLPDLENFYYWIERYIDRYRSQLLNGRPDPGTFFVKWVRRDDIDTTFDRLEFYVAWKAMIRRYGIYNPYTKRGAIKGLLPHGPHCVRDILATHILKETGSYELAGFAIQDTVQTVMRHYARFQPHEKAARAAEIINKVWRQ